MTEQREESWADPNWTEEQAIKKIQGLLNLAAKAGTEAEAAAAAAKAQKLLAQYNLDAAQVEQARGSDGAREQANVEGGHYSFQRDLWKAVAELNFCLYWMQPYLARNSRYSIRIRGEYIGKGVKDQWKRRHMLVGRIVNTRTTIAMTGHLLQAIERTLKEKLSEGGREENMKSRWAWSFRQGCASRIIEKLEDRRAEHLAEEEKAKKKREREAKRASTGASTSTSIALSTYIDEETDKNNDFLHGPGWSAEQAALKAERAKRRKEADEDYTRWCKANPKAAASQWEFKDSGGAVWSIGRSRGGGPRGASGKAANIDFGAYYAGYDAGEAISLDQQVDTPSHRRIAN
jgi:hypothetical protein